jgi:hypothetical protein
MCRVIRVLLLSAIGASAANSQGSVLVQLEAELTAPTPNANGYFGQRMAVSGNRAIVGISTLTVFLHDGSGWFVQGELAAPASATGFGASVAIDKDVAVVGSQGAAYVYDWNGTTWIARGALLPPDGTTGDYGTAVAISGQTALVGHPGDDLAGQCAVAGSVYVFVRDGQTWTFQAKLLPTPLACEALFGYSVALAGNTAIVGAPGVALNAGSAYAFVRHGADWSQQAILASPDPVFGDFLGSAVAVEGDTAAIGARNKTLNGISEAGAVYVFTRSGTSWTGQAECGLPDAQQADQFGLSVALSGNLLAAGAPGRNTTVGADAGSVGIYAHDGTGWNFSAELTAGDAAPSDQLGYAVGLSGNALVASAPAHDVLGLANAGVAYAYLIAWAGTWTDVGAGLRGTNGIPSLEGSGALQPGLPVTLSLTTARPFSLAPLVVGLSNLSAPFKGGVMVPSPNFIFPLFTNFFGEATFGGLWPAGVPSGFTTYFQWWIQDPAGPQGYAASNAVAGTAP